MAVVTTPREDQDPGTESLVEEVLQALDRSLTKLRRRTRDVIKLGRERDELIEAVQNDAPAPVNEPAPAAIPEIGSAVHGESEAFDLSEDSPNFDPGDIAPLTPPEPTPLVVDDEPPTAEAIVEEPPAPAPVTEALPVAHEEPAAGRMKPVVEPEYDEAPRAAITDDSRDEPDPVPSEDQFYDDAPPPSSDELESEPIEDDEDAAPVAAAWEDDEDEPVDSQTSHAEADERTQHVSTSAEPLTEVIVEYDVADETHDGWDDEAPADQEAHPNAIAEYEIDDYEDDDLDAEHEIVDEAPAPTIEDPVDESGWVEADTPLDAPTDDTSDEFESAYIDERSQDEAEVLDHEDDSPFAAEFEEHIEDLGGSLEASPFDLDTPPQRTSYRPRSFQAAEQPAPPEETAAADVAAQAPQHVADAWDDFAGPQSDPEPASTDRFEEPAAPTVGSRLRDLVNQAQEAERERSVSAGSDFDLMEDQPALSRYDKNSAKLPTVGISSEELSSSVASLRSSFTSDKKSDKKSGKSAPESVADRIEASGEKPSKKTAKADAKAAKEAAKDEAKRAKEAARQAEEAAKAQAKAEKQAAKRAKKRK